MILRPNQFEPVPNKFKAHITGDLLFQGLELGMLEFVDFAAVDINEMFVMLASQFIPGLAITDIEFFNHTACSSTPTVR